MRLMFRAVFLFMYIIVLNFSQFVANFFKNILTAVFFRLRNKIFTKLWQRLFLAAAFAGLLAQTAKSVQLGVAYHEAKVYSHHHKV